MLNRRRGVQQLPLAAAHFFKKAIMERAQARPGSRLVLVVEDEPLLLLMAGDLVEDAGLEPIFASNADDAVRILEDREDIGIVFTDVRMPGSIDGIKLAAAVRDRWPPIKLVVVSGHLVGDPDLPEGALFFRKPYRSDEIISTLRKLAA
jgi:two-component system, response regulator PdtaR